MHCFARSPICEADRTLKSVRPIGLSDRSHDFLVRGRARTPTASQICRRVRSASQIWESDRPPTASHGLTDLRVRSASHSWPAVRVRSSGQSHLYRAKQPDRPEDRTLTAGQPWEADRTLKSVRPWEADRTLRSHDFVVRGHARPPTASYTASQIWLSDRSDSLTDLTDLTD